MIVVDANVLIVWSANKTPDLVRARLHYLLETAGKDKHRILIPTPALAEFLVRTDDSTAEWLNELEKKSAVEICAFDRRAAFECAFIERGAHRKGDKKHFRERLSEGQIRPSNRRHCQVPECRTHRLGRRFPAPSCLFGWASGQQDRAASNS
jgi:predicted nucleic acid-binding protein